jgi:hypothetical protein
MLTLSHRWAKWTAVLLLGLLFAQTMLTASRTSLTIDEGLHITSGYSMLRTGDFRLVEEHPPLVKLLAALPLLPVRDLPDPRPLSGWEVDPSVPDTVQLVQVMKHWLQPYRPFDRVVFAARVPIGLLSLLLGAVVFRWASDLAGPWAGLGALGLYAFDPNIVAHSSVATIDLGAAAFITFAVYALWLALRRPTRVGVVLAGVTLGLAQGAKISALMLLPVFVALVGCHALTLNDPTFLSGLQIPRWSYTRGRMRMLIRMGVLLGVMFVLASTTLWAIYGFELRTPPGWSVPVPAASHLIPLQHVRADLATGRTSFLMGQYSERGWWYYFPVAFATKTPLPTLILLCASIFFFAISAARVKQLVEWDLLALTAFPLLYFASAIVQPFNIGYRHLLPMLPLIFVFIGTQIAKCLSPIVYRLSLRAYGKPQISHRTPAALSSGRRVAVSSRLLISLSPYLLASWFLAWYIIGTVRIFPDYLAYFNELVGGPDGGYHYLVDSNLDWGQSWKELKAYIDAHGIARFKFAQFSSNDPSTYGIDYEPIAPMAGAPPVLPSRFNPAPSVYVLSASSLQGVPLADVNSYDYFRHREPAARIGHALFVYDVQRVEPRPGWVAQCAAPAPPLEPADIAEGFGRGDLRVVYFDCAQTFVWPGNTPRGWVVLPYAQAHNKIAFVARWLSQASLTFEQKQSFALPPYSIFLTLGEPSWMQSISLLPKFGQTAELLDYRLDHSTARPSQTVELLTFWRVTGQPPAMLSVMAHLVTEDGRAVAVGDGLGFTADQWQAGDVFVQRSLLQIPAGASGTLWVQTGLYTLDNIQRLPVAVNGAPTGDSLRLTSLQVKP